MTDVIRSSNPVVNEAAERLRGTFRAFRQPIHPRLLRELDEALATERRNIVERIRERLTKAVERRDFMAGPLPPSAMLAILEEIGAGS